MAIEGYLGSASVRPLDVKWTIANGLESSDVAPHVESQYGLQNGTASQTFSESRAPRQQFANWEAVRRQMKRRGSADLSELVFQLDAKVAKELPAE